MERIVVVGTGYAGTLAALRLDKRLGDVAEVTLVGEAPCFVERIRLHERAAGGAPRVRPIASLLAGTGVRFVEGRVRSIDRAARALQLADGATLAWDRLLLAIGSRVDVERVPGAREHARTLDAGAVEALAAEVAADAAAGRRLLVVGGGLTAIEAAAELASRLPSLRVTLATAGRLAAGLFVPRAERHLREALDRLGVAVLEEARVVALAARQARLDGGRALDVDRCLFAGGFVAPPLLAASGFAVNARGQALVDDRLRAVDDPRVWLAGDCAAPVVSVGAPLHMACKTAMPMGAHAADNLAASFAGAPERPFRFGDSAICVSLGRHDGVVQLRRRDGSPSERVYTGRVAAWIKEQVCRYTVWSLRLEKRAGWRYRWLAPPPARYLSSGEASPSLPSDASLALPARRAEHG